MSRVSGVSKTYSQYHHANVCLSLVCRISEINLSYIQSNKHTIFVQESSSCSESGYKAASVGADLLKMMLRSLKSPTCTSLL